MLLCEWLLVTHSLSSSLASGLSQWRRLASLPILWHERASRTRECALSPSHSLALSLSLDLPLVSPLASSHSSRPPSPVSRPSRVFDGNSIDRVVVRANLVYTLIHISLIAKCEKKKKNKLCLLWDLKFLRFGFSLLQEASLDCKDLRPRLTLLWKWPAGPLTLSTGGDSYRACCILI